MAKHLAIVGATGAVGREFCGLIAERDLKEHIKVDRHEKIDRDHQEQIGRATAVHAGIHFTRALTANDHTTFIRLLGEVVRRGAQGV